MKQPRLKSAGSFGKEETIMKKRLAVIYGEKASFEIKNRPEGGVVSKIVIPFTYSEPEGEMDLLEELDNFDNSDDEV